MQRLGYRGQRAFRIFLGLILAAFCILADKQSTSLTAASVQGWIIALGPIGVIAVELGRMLFAKKDVRGIVLLMASHALVVYSLWSHLPFRNSFSLVFICYLESLLLGIFYVLLSTRSDSGRVPPLVH